MARITTLIAFVPVALASSSAQAEPLPELPVDEAIVESIEALAPGEALRLPDFTVVGEGLDAYETFATRGPGIRDFCDKWVWAEDRGRALYAGGNHGVPHKFDDLWEYDLESNTWVMLHAPDPGVEPSHTWWGLTYDQARSRVMWMAPTTPGVWDMGGYEGPPLRFYDTQAQTGWDLVITDPPHIRVSLAAALEYIPNRDVLMFHSNNWDGSGLQQYDPVANVWTELIPQEELYFDNPDAPPTESIITYNSVNDVLVGFHERSVYVYEFDANTWTRVLENVGDEETSIRDSGSGSDYDPYADLHFAFDGGRLFTYDVAANAMTELEVEGLPEFGMVYFDRELGVLVIYDESSSHVVYRHEPLPEPGDDESGSESSAGEDSSSSSSSSDPPAADDSEGSDTTAVIPDASSSDGGTSADLPEDPADAASGCSCRATSPDASMWLAAIVLLAAARRRRVTLAIALASLSGCYRGADARASADDATATESDGDANDGTISDGNDGTDSDDDSDPLISECRAPTYEVFQRLAPTCEGCHGEGTTVPLAVDLVSFEQLVVYNEDLVRFGRPGESNLLDMLAGTAPPPLAQMPPGSLSFEEMAELGATAITMDEIAAWIEDLEPCDMPGGVQSPRFARRVSVEQIQAALMDQLDLQFGDVEHVSRFPIDDPTFPSFASGHNSREEAQARWQALGGPAPLYGDIRNSDFGPLFIQTLGPTAQAWCRRSIGLGRDALFRHVGSDSDSAQDEDAIRQNIRFLFLKMLGVVANDEDVDAMYRSVYLPYEAAEGSTTAWVGVCSAFVRHPLWLTY